MSTARADDARGFRVISPRQDSYRDLWTTVFIVGFPEHSRPLGVVF